MEAATVGHAAIIPPHAVNLAALQTLVAAPPVGYACPQEPPMPSQFLDDGFRRQAMQPQAPHGLPFDYSQVLRQFALSAAVAAATGLQSQQAPNSQTHHAQHQPHAPIPWWMINSSAQAAQPNQLLQHLQGWRRQHLLDQQGIQPAVPNELGHE